VRYLGGALHDAQNAKAEVVIIKMSTPGGSVDSMRSIVSDIFASRTGRRLIAHQCRAASPAPS